MKIAAMHVKRKQLHQLLPSHVLQKRKKVCQKGVDGTRHQCSAVYLCQLVCPDSVPVGRPLLTEHSI